MSEKSQQNQPQQSTEQPKRPKPCCACPETRKPRDECVFQYGEEDVNCKKLIAAHHDCMRKLGFNI